MPALREDVLALREDVIALREDVLAQCEDVLAQLVHPPDDTKERPVCYWPAGTVGESQTVLTNEKSRLPCACNVRQCAH